MKDIKFPRYFRSNVWTKNTKYLKVDNEITFGTYYYSDKPFAQSRVVNLNICLNSDFIEEISDEEIVFLI